MVEILSRKKPEVEKVNSTLRQTRRNNSRRSFYPWNEYWRSSLSVSRHILEQFYLIKIVTSVKWG